MFWYQFFVGFFGTTMLLFGYKSLRELAVKQLVDKITMSYFYIFAVSAILFVISTIVFILKVGVIIE